jgi:hypothetical protein
MKQNFTNSGLGHRSGGLGNIGAIIRVAAIARYWSAQPTDRCSCGSSKNTGGKNYKLHASRSEMLLANEINEAIKDPLVSTSRFSEFEDTR